MDLTFLSELNIKVIKEAKLSEFTTFQLGGRCKALVECTHAYEVTAAVTALRALDVPFIVMGFGSNILASDHGLDMVIIRYSSKETHITRNGNVLKVDAATQFDDLVRWSVEEGLDGLTAMSGIPGTVGGAIAGNAGAYGQQISDRLIRVTLLNPDNTVVDIPKSAINFSYRDSDIKHNGAIVLYAMFELKPTDDLDAMKKEREEKLSARKEKHGDWKVSPCAGSFFKNVLPSSNAGQRQSAGWFLEAAGCKELNIGGAHSYCKHANIVTRDNGATAQAVYDLTAIMQKLVQEKFAIELVREVRLLGKFAKASNCNPEGYW